MGRATRVSRNVRHLGRLLSTEGPGKGPKGVGQGTGGIGKNPVPTKPGQEPLRPPNKPPKKTPTFTGRTPPASVQKSQPLPPSSSQKPSIGQQSQQNPTSNGNKWLLSPNVPVDVRLVAGGLLVFGGFLTYSYFRQVEKSSGGQEAKEIGVETAQILENQENLGRQEQNNLQDQSSFYTDEIASDSSQNSEDSNKNGEVSGQIGNDDNKDALPQVGGNILLQEEIQALSQAQEKDDPGAREVGELLGSVFSGAPLDENQLREVYEKAGISGDIEKPEGDKETPSENKSDAQEPSKEEYTEHPPKPSLQNIQETLEAVKHGMAGDAAEAMLSSHFQAKSSKVNKDDSAGKVDQAGSGESSSSSNKESSNSKESLSQAYSSDKNQLGITEDLRPPALVKKATERGQGVGDNWAEYKPRLLQAEADSQTFQIALDQALKHKSSQEKAKQAEIEELEGKILELKERLRDNAALYKKSIEEHIKFAENDKAEELRRQAEHLAHAHAEMSLKERSIRSRQIDQIRQQLNGLSQAFNHRSTAAKNSHSIHKLSLGTFALSHALEEGLPFQSEAESLEKSCPDDDLIKAVINTLPNSVSHKGVETQAELLDKWPETRNSLRQLSFLSPGKTNLVGLGLASLATRLKVKEIPDLNASNSIDQNLARIDAKLVNGRLSDAAELIQQTLKGTGAEKEAERFAQKLRARAIIHQSVKVLEAHASSGAASLS